MIFCDCDWYPDGIKWVGANDYSESKEPCKCIFCSKNIGKGETVRVYRKHECFSWDVVINELQDPDNEITINLVERKVPYYLAEDPTEGCVVVWGEEIDPETVGVLLETSHACERCADMTFSLEALGYCYEIGRDIVKDWKELVSGENDDYWV